MRSSAEKVRIVEETLTGAVVVREVAKRHGLNPSVLFRWRRLHRDGLLMREGGGDIRGKVVPAGLLAVKVQRSTPANKQSQQIGVPSEEAQPGVIEVQFTGGRSLCVRGAVDGATLRAVIGELSRP